MSKKILLLLSLMILTACNANPFYQGTSDSGDNLHQPAKSEGEGPIFQIISSQVLEPKCLRCHSESGGNRGGVNLEGYNNVRRFLPEIKSAIESNFMPPRNPLEQDLKDLLLKWIELGAPEA